MKSSACDGKIFVPILLGAAFPPKGLEVGKSISQFGPRIVAFFIERGIGLVAKIPKWESRTGAPLDATTVEAIHVVAESMFGRDKLHLRGLHYSVIKCVLDVE